MKRSRQPSAEAKPPLAAPSPHRIASTVTFGDDKLRDGAGGGRARPLGEYPPTMREDRQHPSAVASGTTLKPLQDLLGGVASSAAPPTGMLGAVAGKKRQRDINGLEKFKQVVFGENGLPRLQALVQRNPILMYPPKGIHDARRRLQVEQQLAEAEKQRAADELARRAEEQSSSGGTSEEARSRRADEELWALFEQRRKAEEEAEGVDRATSNARAPEASASTEPSNSDAVPRLNPAQLARCKELATYHHQQLDAYLSVLYEFNHLTFVKMPMKNTLAMLRRCGKAAFAHTMEFETLQRANRHTWLMQVREARRAAVDRLEQQRRRAEACDEAEIQRIEAKQRQLGLGDDAEVPGGAATTRGEAPTESLYPTEGGQSPVGGGDWEFPDPADVAELDTAEEDPFEGDMEALREMEREQASKKAALRPPSTPESEGAT